MRRSVYTGSRLNNGLTVHWPILDTRASITLSGSRHPVEVTRAAGHWQ